jgi:diaminobutyrate-2-oxoglutarate transaminase
MTETLDKIARQESEVRSYCRSFPAIFEKAKGSYLYDDSGKRYTDFFSGAGAINYGHNNDRMRQALLTYIEGYGITHSLDMATTAKREFMDRFESSILAPRGLDFKMQFTGPGGTNAVETALKIARLTTGRSHIAAFTNGYHGLTLGALALTSNAQYRNEAFVDRSNASFLPFEGYLGRDMDTIAFIRKLLEDSGSGFDLPAAILLETIQAEGGVNVAGMDWLRGLAALCREFGILLIIDDIQVGCGRTGTFFSFEQAGIHPDIAVLSKSISGYGLPMSVVLMRPELDRWKPGEETATFRGHNLSFVTAAAALVYWESDGLARGIQAKSDTITRRLEALAERHAPHELKVRGKGLIYGLEIADSDNARAVSREAFAKGLVIELCGPMSNVLKLLPPLVIEDSELEEGLDILEQSLGSVLNRAP